MTQTLWWQRGVVYQIYPRSFMDSNGDGIGDLSGVMQKLDYLQWLGVDAIWFSPTFPSPMKDFGYDVADYKAVHPDFGTMADMEALIAAAKARGIRVILDLVPNHTSDQHAWFVESRSSRDNPKRDWYIWRDPAPDGSVPNNWLSVFGGSAWELDAATGQYYLHNFLKEQPDLNYRNPEVVRAMQDSIAFWLDKGIDGFRVDVIDFMLKDAQFRDEPPNPNFSGGNPWDSLLHLYSRSQPEVSEIVRAFREVFDEFSKEGSERVMIGEVNYFEPIDYLVKQYGAGGELQHLPFNFTLVWSPMKANMVREHIDAYDAALPAFAWPNYVMGNHDVPRLATRTAFPRTAAMLLLTLRGTPFIYYGDELGMENVDIPQDQVQDPWGINVPGFGRDPERTPMQWNAAPNAGFTSAERGWLPVAPNYATNNVEAQRADPHSMLNLYQQLLTLRRELPALNSGRYYSFDRVPEACFVYMRQYNDQRILVALNFSTDAQTMTFSGFGQGTVLLSTLLDRQGAEPMTDFTLRPSEGCIIEVAPEDV